VITLVNDFLVQTSLNAMDKIFATMDRVKEEGVSQPLLDASSGNVNSVISWEDIGKNGKPFLTSGPDQAEFTGRPALQPIRIYAGFNTGKDFEERAAIAVQDLVRPAALIARPWWWQPPPAPAGLTRHSCSHWRSCIRATLRSSRCNIPVCPAVYDR